MFLKLFVVLSLCATFSRGHGHEDHAAHHVQEICSTNTDPTCRATAEKCVFNLESSASLTFCNCMKSIDGVKLIYNTWVAKEHDGIDLCTNKEHGGAFPEAHGADSSGGKGHISFNDYLHKENHALDEKLECCVGKARGLFDNDGKAIVSAWTKNTSLMKDAAAQTAVLSSINQCASSTKTSCSAHDFMHCVLDGCYATLLKV